MKVFSSFYFSQLLPVKAGYKDAAPILKPFDNKPGSDSLEIRFTGNKSHGRYIDMVKGRAREELKKNMQPDDMLGVQGGKIINVPIKTFQLPRFAPGENPAAGPPGTEGGEGKQGPGKNAGEDPGQHAIDESWDFERTEAADILQEDLELPDLQPKGKATIHAEDVKFNTFRNVGPLMDQARTVRKAIERTAKETGSAEVDIDTLEIQPEDHVYLAWNQKDKPSYAALIVYIIDVSGSMGEDQKQMAREVSYWADTFIGTRYGKLNANARGNEFTNDQFDDGVQRLFIVHDVSAKSVDRQTFFLLKEDGGTKISSAYDLLKAYIKGQKPLDDGSVIDPNNTNIYVFQFSDGDNSSEADSKNSMKTLAELMPDLNMFGYVQVNSAYGSGNFIHQVQEAMKSEPKVRTIRMKESSGPERRGVLKALLGKESKK